MSNSNQDPERDPRISRGLVGRICAVGLFIALGTFAVIQMMSGDSTKPNPAIAQNGDLDPNASNGQPPANGPADASTDAQGLPALPTSASIKTASIFDTQGAPPSAPPTRIASSSPFDANNGPGTFQPTAPSRQSSFEPGENFKPIQAPPIITSAKPPTQPSDNGPTANSPPTRYAQLPGSGAPIIGNDSGFGARPIAPAADLPKNAFDDVAKKSVDAASQFGGNISNGANRLLDQTRQGIGNAVENVADKLPGVASSPAPFGFTGNNQNAPPPSQPKSFEPPTNRPSEPTANKSFAPPALPTGLPREAGTTPPTMTAPTPSPNGFDSGRGLRPMDNGFSDRPTSPANPPTQSRLQSFPPSTPPTVDSDRVNGINQTGNGPNVQSKSGFPAPSNSPNEAFSRPQVPAQQTSAVTNSPTINRPAAAQPRTTNVPGDRQLEGVQAPALTVEKLSPREIQVNTPADFEIVVRNVGRVNAEDVQINDQIPAGTEFLGSSPEPGNLSPDRRIVWELGTLKSGQEKRIKYQLKPVQPGEIGSVANVTFATQASMRTLVTKPVLEIVHQTKSTVLIGSDVILDVVVANKGDGPAKNVLIQEDVPKQLEYQGGYRELEYEVGTLMPGQSKRIQLGLKAAEIGRLKNLIFASAEGGLRAQHEIDVEVVAPRLTTASDGPTRRFLQREATHQFKIGNQGTAPATNVDLVANLPAGLRFVSANNQGKYNPGSHAVFWSIAELGMNVNATVELVTMPVEVGAQNIKFEAIADLKQKSATQQELNVEHLIDVFFDIDDVVDPIEIGADTSYKIRVVNQGTQAATNVQLQVEFPTGMIPTGAEGSLQNQIQGQRIQFAPISSLKPGDQLELLVRAKGQSAGDHRVVLMMQADGRQTPVSKEETTRVYADR